MTQKTSFSEKLKQYRHDQAENYAKAILSPPKRVNNIYTAMRFPGVAIIMGDIRAGKTGLAHEIARQFHVHRSAPAAFHLPTISDAGRAKVQHRLPKWMKVTNKRSQWPENAVVIYDEAAQTAHARRGQSGDALELDDLLAIAGQREQLVIFISHHSRKLDVNACTAVHRIIWKRPTYAHKLWEREEMADFSMKAYDFFDGIRGEIARKKASLILNMDEFGFMCCNNQLPPWWDDNISKVFREIQEKSQARGGVFQ